MKKIFLVVMLISVVTTLGMSKAHAALTKRSFYDLFGESLNAQYWVLGLTDQNKTSGGGSVLRAEGWGLLTEQVYRFNYSDKYQKVKTTFDIGFHYYISGGTYWSTDLFDVSLTPLTFQKVWFPGMRATLVTPSHSGTLLFSRTSNMYLTATQSSVSSNIYLVVVDDKYKLKIGDVNLTLGGTFMNHWNENSSIDENSFFGNITDSATTYVTLRFSDDSPEDGYGAALYSLEYSVDNGAYAAVSVSPSPQTADGASVFTKSFGVPSTAKSIRIRMRIANDYKVEIASPSYIKIAYAQGNPKDGAIKEIVYTYGLSTANQIVGFNAKGDVLGVKVDMECEYNLRWRKVLISGGERTFDMSPAFFLKANKKFDKLLVGGDVWYMDPEYTTTLGSFKCIDDNDDKDWYDDSVGAGSGGGKGTDPAPPFWHLLYDRDSYKTLDWEQDFYLFTVDPARFWIGDDRNNNVIADQYEDDPYPDYPYRVNQQGYGIFTSYDLLEGVTITGGYDDFGEVSSANKTNNLYLVSRYKTKVPDFGDILLYHQIKKVNDNVKDDMTEISSEDGTAYIGSDILNYKNSLFNVFYAESNYTGFKNFTLSNKFRLENNYQYDDSRNVKWAGFVTNVKYDIKPTKLFTVTPQWKLSLEKGFSVPEYSTYSTDKQTNAFLLKFVYKVFEKTTFTGGIQYKILRLPLNTSYEYNKLSFVAQIVSRAGSYPLQIGYVRNLKNTPTSPTYQKDETTFLKLFIVK